MAQLERRATFSAPLCVEGVEIEKLSTIAEPGSSFQEIKMLVGGMTCGSCVSRVQKALLSVRGVTSAKVDLAAGTAVVSYDSALVALPNLAEVVSAAGYQSFLRQDEMSVSRESETVPLTPGRSIPLRPVAFGILAAILLSGLYVAIVGVAQGLDHATDLMITDWYFVVPIVVGFGIQVGLFVYVRSGLHLRRGTGSTTALAGAGTGTSTVSMVACCAHHLTDVLPIIGLSGAAIFLNEYRGPLMALGILTNAIGIAVMVRLIRRSRHLSCATSA
ncbi:MAG: cation transporter [Chloroflexi bacterium]|nr:cation transporter [Chloroflexota bacterium]